MGPESDLTEDAMGDRANCVFEDGDSSRLFLCTHWGGTELAEDVRTALDIGRDRWSDPAYLARIVFDARKGDDFKGLTGFGISTSRPDNEHLYVVVNCDKQTVRFEDEESGKTIKGPWSFAEYCDMDKGKLDKAYGSDRE